MKTVTLEVLAVRIQEPGAIELMVKTGFGDQKLMVAADLVMIKFQEPISC